jgi:type IV pilus assembly protein PilC
MIFMLEEKQPLPFALEAASQTAEIRFYRHAVQALGKKIGQGEPLSQALGEAGIFPAQIASITAVIEDNADAMAPLLSRLADRYEVQTANAIKNLKTNLEPLFIVIIGIVVGGLVFSMYLPIFKLAGAVGG